MVAAPTTVVVDAATRLHGHVVAFIVGTVEGSITSIFALWDRVAITCATTGASHCCVHFF